MSRSLVNISRKARIGKRVEVGSFSTIYDDVEIGDGTWIGPNVTIMEGTRIGKNCKIFPGAVIGAIPQDLKFKGEKTSVEIGNDSVIREFVTINRGTVDKYKTAIGSHCLIMAYVHVAHDCIVGNSCILANSVTLAGHVEIDDHVVLEGLVAVQQFVRIGTHAFVGGASLVRKNVPPYVKAAREPLSYAGINSIGLRRRGISEEIILHIEDIYRIIYVKSTNVSQALKIVELETPNSKEKKNIVEFIKNSPKGIMRGYS